MKETGGSAFPREFAVGNGVRAIEPGLTVRDYFAVQAMNGVISGTEIDLAPEHIAKVAYVVADAMLKERSKS